MKNHQQSGTSVIRESVKGGERPNSNLYKSEKDINKEKHLDISQYIQKNESSYGIDSTRIMFKVEQLKFSAHPLLEVVQEKDLTYSKGKKRQKDRPLFTTETGEKIRGIFAFLNTEGINVYVCSMPKKGKGYETYCFVTFSVAGLAGNGNNYLPTTLNETMKVFSQVAQFLTSIGVYVDFFKGEVSRVDIFTQHNLDRPLSDWHPIFEAMRFAHMEQKLYQNSIYSFNRQQCFVAYGKYHEMLRRGVDVTGVSPDCVRFEHRLLKAKKVRSWLEITTVEDLLRDFHKLPERFNEAFRKCWFSHDCQDAGSKPIQASKSADAVKDQLREITALYGSRGRQEVTVRRLSAMLRHHGIKAVAKYLTEFACVPKQTRSDYIRSLARAHFQAVLNTPVPNRDLRYRDLYTQMKTLVLAPQPVKTDKQSVHLQSAPSAPWNSLV